MAKLFLHAGTYKTGTTALQQFAHANRGELLQRGLFYADYGDDPLTLRFGHHEFAYALADNEPETFRRLARIVDYWRRVSDSEGVPVLFSAETLFLRRLKGSPTYWQGRSDYMKRLADLLSPFDVEVVLVYRRPDNFARSLYQERVASGIKRLPPFHEWLAKGDPMLEYSRNATIIQEAFSCGSHYTYEEMASGGRLYRDFFNHMGVSISGLEVPDMVRKSLTPAETVIKNSANDHIGRVQQGRRFVKWMKDEGLGRRLEEMSSTALDLWSSPQERANFLASRGEDVATLKSRFFPDRGADALFPEFADEGPYEVPELTPEIQAKIREFFD